MDEHCNDINGIMLKFSPLSLVKTFVSLKIRKISTIKYEKLPMVSKVVTDVNRVLYLEKKPSETAPLSLTLSQHLLLQLTECTLTAHFDVARRTKLESNFSGLRASHSRTRISARIGGGRELCWCVNARNQPNSAMPLHYYKMNLITPPKRKYFSSFHISQFRKHSENTTDTIRFENRQRTLIWNNFYLHFMRNFRQVRKEIVRISSRRKLLRRKKTATTFSESSTAYRWLCCWKTSLTKALKSFQNGSKH